MITRKKKCFSTPLIDRLSPKTEFVNDSNDEGHESTTTSYTLKVQTMYLVSFECSELHDDLKRGDGALHR